MKDDTMETTWTAACDEGPLEALLGPPTWTAGAGARTVAPAATDDPTRGGALHAASDDDLASRAEAALRDLRDLAAPAPRRAEAWGEVAAWIEAQGWIRPRLQRWLRAQQLTTRLGPEDVLNAFALEAFTRPSLLGDGRLPSRSWLWWRLQDTGRQLARKVHEPLPGDLDQAHEVAAPRALADATCPEAVTWTRALGREVQRALARLAQDHPDQHQALVMKSERSYPEVARAMQRPIGTVKSLVQRARLQLRARLGHLLDAREEGRHGR